MNRFHLLLIVLLFQALPLFATTQGSTSGHWRFEADPGFANDSGPHGLSLGTTGSAPSAHPLPSSGGGAAFPRTLADPPVQNHQAASFAGSGNFLREHNSALATPESFTIEALVRRTATSSQSLYIAARWEFSDNANQRSWGLAVAGSNPPAGTSPGELFLLASPDGQTLTVIGSGLPLPPHTDSYVAASFAPGQVRFMYRNLEDGSGLVTTEVSHDLPSLHPGTGAFTIGAYDRNRQRWIGLIDEVRLSSSVRQPGELLVDGEPSAPPPLFVTEPGDYLGFVRVKLETHSPAHEIRFTLDGSMPDDSSELYTAPIQIEQTTTVRARAFLTELAPSPAVSGTFTIRPFPLLGHVRPRPSKEIHSSMWSIGTETLDRGFAVYEHYREYLGNLGAKSNRVQAGWARTEQSPGVYDWDWLDEPVFDAIARGVRPWMNVSYGNPIYPGGGEARLFGGAPTSEVAKAAWDAWLAAMVERYQDVIHEWEIWNEPVGHVSLADYTDLYIRSAEIIRGIQPEARLIAIAFAGINFSFLNGFLSNLEEVDKLHLVDEISYHQYVLNPEQHYNDVQRLRDDIAAYDPRITIRQGENGAPSRRGGFGALTNFDWTEQTQAKWNLRRMMGDHGRGIPNSLFAIADMQYDSANNDKGILLTDPVTQEVIRPKEAYHAAQHVYSIFDHTIGLGSGWPVSHNGPSSLNVFRHEHPDGRRLITAWIGGSTPAHNRPFNDYTFTLPAAGFEDPVWVDLRTGNIHAFPADSITFSEDQLVLSEVPVYDSPILIAERSLVLRPYDQWAAEEFTAAQYRDPSISSTLASPAGRPNLLRFAFSLPDSAPVVRVTEDDRLSLSFFRAHPDLTYEIHVSTDLIHWNHVATDPGNAGEIATWTSEALDDRKFVRVEIKTP